MTTLANTTICISCVHLRPSQPRGYFTCDAFPNGIPAEYIRGEKKHTEPDPRDGGIQYERDPGWDNIDISRL